MTGQGLSSGEQAVYPSSEEKSGAMSVDTKPVGSLLNPVFAKLVEAEDDIVGLLAYALYKQNKRDWFVSFFKEHNRQATEGEVEAYHLGERSPRRVLTYRRLAVDVLAKDPGGREGEGLSTNYAGKASRTSNDRDFRPASFAEGILAHGWSPVLVGVLALAGVVAVVIVALLAFSPGILKQILP
jgi:hypothetical protein